MKKTTHIRIIIFIIAATTFSTPLHSQQRNDSLVSIVSALASHLPLIAVYDSVPAYSIEGGKQIASKPGKPLSSYVMIARTYKGNDGTVYPVYKSEGGKYFIIRRSRKTGHEYKYYLTGKSL